MKKPLLSYVIGTKDEIRKRKEIMIGYRKSGKARFMFMNRKGVGVYIQDFKMVND